MITLTEEGDYPGDYKALIRDYGEEAIRCCIDSWNGLCPQYQLTNVTEVIHKKRGLFHSHDIEILEEEGGYGQISKISFEVNQHLTSKAFRKHKDSPQIVVDCCTWWDCGKCRETHGWKNHITVDVMKGCVTDFPEVNPASPHLFCCPVP